MTERRRAPRHEIEILFNKHVRGQPHLCRLTELSASGLSSVWLGGPETDPGSFTVELRLPGDGPVIWAWARTVWRRGRREAARFVALRPDDARRIERYLQVHAA